MHKTILLLIIFSFSLTSCCSTCLEQTEQVTIITEPHHANVFIDGYSCGTTPLIVELDKRYDHRIDMIKPGYEGI